MQQIPEAEDAVSIDAVAAQACILQANEVLGRCEHVLSLSRRNAASPGIMEQARIQADAAVTAITQLVLQLDRVRPSAAEEDAHVSVMDALSRMQDNLARRLNDLQSLDVNNEQRYLAEQSHSGQRGKPKLCITADQLISLRQINFKWSQIARLLGVSKATLYRRREDFNLLGANDPATIVSDEELDVLVGQITSESTGAIGTSVITGALRARGVFVHRSRVYTSLKRSDPVGLSIRRTARIQRRQYWVPGPGSLWHVDTWHKIGPRYGIVIFGGIDGYSRCIVFMRASNNNRSDTMVSFYEEAVTKWNFPSRLRTDRGKENVGIAQLMVEARGPNRGSHIAGPSTKNQRIERNWKDMRMCAMQGFKDLFASMEENDDLDIGNCVHLMALQYVFIPRINQMLDDYVEYWNNHPIRTTRSLSPYQQYVEGVFRLYHSQFTAVREIVDDHLAGEQDWSNYGVDPEGVEDTENHTRDSEPEVNSIPDSLAVERSIVDELRQRVNPLANVEDGGYQLYLDAKAFLELQLLGSSSAII